MVQATHTYSYSANQTFRCFANSPPGRTATTLDDSLPGRFATLTFHDLDVLPMDDKERLTQTAGLFNVTSPMASSALQH